MGDDLLPRASEAPRALSIIPEVSEQGGGDTFSDGVGRRATTTKQTAESRLRWLTLAGTVAVTAQN